MSGADAGTATAFREIGPLDLESGEKLPSVTIAYRTWGRLGPQADNAVLVCHGFTASADVERWWSPLLGEGRSLDPTSDFVVCSNVLGGCHGSTGPASPRPDGRGRWGASFPRITIRDMVRAQAALLDGLGVRRLRLVLGGSLGGMQVLEWALMFPDRVDAIAPIAAPARHSAWAIALAEAQRAALAADPRWRGGDYPAHDPPLAGLATARQLAMCTYRSHVGLEARFSRGRAVDGRFSVGSWLDHHGTTFGDRFDAASYAALTHAMDSHDVGRGRGGWREALARAEAEALVVSIDSDLLYPPIEQQELAGALPRAQLVTLRSVHGHDAFLIEADAVDRRLRTFRAELASARASRGETTAPAARTAVAPPEPPPAHPCSGSTSGTRGGLGERRRTGAAIHAPVRV